MMETLQPGLTDLARFVAMTTTSGHDPATEPLFQWLLKRHLELDEEAREADVSPFDIAELRICLHTDAFTQRAAEVAVCLLNQVPETAELLKRLETRSRDIGLADDWRTEAPKAVQLTDQVDRLVDNHEWDVAARFIEANVLGEPVYDQWVTILEARLARGEGNRERLEAVRDKLRSEATTLQTSFSLLLQGDFSAFLGNDPEN